MFLYIHATQHQSCFFLANNANRCDFDPHNPKIIVRKNDLNIYIHATQHYHFFLVRHIGFLPRESARVRSQQPRN